ncbi:MAG: DNA polymerase III subunit delta [Bacteroidales bacterium]|nr:DNA polymerase III subunit delta [Bacteroidales bacterium]MCF8386581.1 DNA polymerase III subunit delta [Bacteroidales bacterium]MCF8398127.1 DNA polymerase III subunit delta [Bacteroidales bacterium]
MKYEQILNDIENKIYYPVYLLSGEESYFVDRISDEIENNILSETEKEFNQNILYGRDVDAPTIVSYAKRYPMMANYQVVIIKEAQDLKDIEDLAGYAEKPLESTVLVLCYKYKKIDKRKLLAKNVQKKGVLYESPRIYDNKVPDWIMNNLKSKGYSITPKAAAMMTEFLGTSLSKISNEISKLTINVPRGTEIKDVHIEENIGISKDYNVFELQKALGSKDVVKANKIINYFAANQKDNPLVKVVAILYGYFSKVMMYHQIKDKNRNNVASILSVNPFFVADYQLAARRYTMKNLMRVISLLREYDMKSKGVGSVSTDDGQLMKELVFKIMH